MEPISFTLAVVGACIECGKFLIAKYEDYKSAEYDVGENVLQMKSVWLKTEIQLETIQKIWKSIDPRLQKLFSELLDHLNGKLEVARRNIDKVIEQDEDSGEFEVKKFKAMTCKKAIVEAMADLDKWQGQFDPSWYLITRVPDSRIDGHLKDGAETGKIKQIREAMSATPNEKNGSIFIDRQLIEGEHQRVSFSTSFTTRLTDGGGDVLIDPMNSGGLSDPKLDIVHVRDLARRLSNSDPWQFGLLHCRGVVKNTDARGTQFQLVFDIPPSLSSPRTLRDLLVHNAPQSLDQRFQLAKQLVRSLMFVHTSGFVHKGIRPDTVIVFKDKNSVIGPSFLIGFERFRPNNARSRLIGDTSWEMNIYRHPQRQGLYPEETYVMQHDIYSLGVCLLEIGFWDSFVYQESSKESRPGPQFDPSTGNLMPRKPPMPSKPGQVLKSIATDIVAGKYPVSIQQELVSIARDKLPGLMGRRYTDLTLACLTCLDPIETNLFGNEKGLADKDGIVVGVRYIEKILLQIDEISI
ncbi:hypothetical protein BJX68DRAFT_260058 [Aspergillus pseudodeflectus]|uniref:Protein kinase domain-containing protein n=1 Tax=Aspergillus pseudodeflectus TaxID=176178 RepID=A0ABR4J7J6_9EURO